MISKGSEKKSRLRLSFSFIKGGVLLERFEITSNGSESESSVDPSSSDSSRPSVILRLVLGLCWYLLHIVVSIVHAWSNLVQMLLCCMISYGLLKKYKNIKLDKLRYLAIVIDSAEAKDKIKVKQLLHWLSVTGVKHIILYDMEGVLKKYVQADPLTSNGDAKTANGFLKDRQTTLEVLSFSDNKEGIAKAASFLCSKHMKAGIDSKEKQPVFTEADIGDALGAVGCGGPDPDLLLVYGPARCHLGFPAWRIRYTEIVYMGPLKSSRYGGIVKAIYDFTKKNQNYGS